MNPWKTVSLAAAASLAASSCSGVGPQTIKNDRIDYSSAIATSWKDQTILNIVKIRYLDTPVFLDVASVISSHELRTEASVTPRIFPRSPVDTYIEGEVSGRWTDHPTISYTPLTGERLINAQLRPIPPETVFAMIAAGHDAAFVLRVSVRAINGVYNHFVALSDEFKTHSEFEPVTAALRRLQFARALGTRSDGRGTKERTFVFFRTGVHPDLDRDIQFIKRALRLDPGRNEYLLTANAYPRPGELAILARSLHEILAELAVGVEVPPEDIEAGSAGTFGRIAERVGTVADPLLHIRSGSVKPPDAYAAIFYRNRWFWIDDGDLRSKRVFLFVHMFAALAETQPHAQVPVLTTSTR